MIRACVAVTLTILIANAATAGTLDEVSAMVVYLEAEKPETAIIDGVTFEIGVRRPGEPMFSPRVVRQYGTGFLVAREQLLALVTAKHVAAFLTPDSKVTIRADLEKPLIVTLRDLTGWQGALRWVQHPSADVAVVSLRPNQNILPKLTQHFLPASDLAKETPSRDVPLTVVGFPLSLGAARLFSPLSRESRAASGLLETPQGDRVFLLQDPSVGGYSGAPVFDLGGAVFTDTTMTLHSARTCVGLISATLADETGGKFATVVPASYVLQLLDEL